MTTMKYTTTTWRAPAEDSYEDSDRGVYTVTINGTTWKQHFSGWHGMECAQRAAEEIEGLFDAMFAVAREHFQQTLETPSTR